jgi:hypothetical protein
MLGIEKKEAILAKNQQQNICSSSLMCGFNPFQPVPLVDRGHGDG